MHLNFYPNRAESDRASMAKDLYERDHQLKQFILAVTKFAETLKVWLIVLLLLFCIKLILWSIIRSTIKGE